jgi:acyl carrier protein
VIHFLLMVGEMDSTYAHSIWTSRDKAAAAGARLEKESGHDFEIIHLDLDPDYDQRQLWFVRLNRNGHCIHCSQKKLDAGAWDTMVPSPEGSSGHVLALDAVEAMAKASAITDNSRGNRHLSIPNTEFFYKRFLKSHEELGLVKPKSAQELLGDRTLHQIVQGPSAEMTIPKHESIGTVVEGNGHRYIINNFDVDERAFFGEDETGHEVRIGDRYFMQNLMPVDPAKYIGEGQVWKWHDADYPLVIVSVGDGVTYTGMGGHVYGSSIESFTRNAKIKHFVQEKPCPITPGVIKMIAECIGKSDFDLMNTLREDLEMDSLDFTETAVLLEDEFEIDIPDAVADTFRTVNDIIMYIKEQKNVKS